MRTFGPEMPADPQAAHHHGLDRVFPAVVVAITALILILGLTPFGAATSPDSLRYLDVARNIRDGHGVVVTEHAGPDAAIRYRPFTAYGPLYPMVLALFIDLDEVPERSAALMAVVTLTLAGLLMLELLRPAVGVYAATLGALVFLVSQPTLTVYAYAWSGSLTLPILLFAVWCSLQYIAASATGQRRRPEIYLGLIVLSLALLVWCRYIGIFFSILLPLTWLLSSDRRRRIPHFAAAGACLGLLAGLVALRNYRLSGYLSGAVREVSSKSLADNLSDFWAALSIQFSTKPIVMIASAAVCLGVTLAKWVRFSPSDARRRPPVYPGHLLWICLACAASYAVGLIGLRTLRELDQIDTRFVMPSFTLFLILLSLAGGRMLTSLARSVPRAIVTAASVFLLVMIAAQGLSTYRRASAGWAWHSSVQFPLSHDTTYFNNTVPQHERNPTAALVERAYHHIRRENYGKALREVDIGLAFYAQEYELHRAAVLASAPLGQLGRSVVHARRCLELDRERAERDIVSMGKRFREDPRLHRTGIEFFETLGRDLPDAWWTDYNLAELQALVGETELAAESKCQGLLKRAESLLAARDYQTGLVDAVAASETCSEKYRVCRILAQTYAGLGDVQSSLEHTRECLELDREQARRDIPAISSPFWHDANLYAAGVDYYQRLSGDLPEAWWVYQNIGDLAERAGESRLAATAHARAKALGAPGKRRATPDP